MCEIADATVLQFRFYHVLGLEVSMLCGEAAIGCRLITPLHSLSGRAGSVRSTADGSSDRFGRVLTDVGRYFKVRQQQVNKI